jgi:hypothetical protein
VRYVTLPPDATVPQIDAALDALRARRKATGFALIRGWVDAEIDLVLDLRSKASKALV